MKRSLLAIAGIVLLASLSFAKSPAKSPADSAKDQRERLQNAGQVIQEILNLPDDIPQDLLDKARCVIVLPSVLKAAFIVGGSYGRGAMVCRTGKDFNGPWGPPIMVSLEGGSIVHVRFQIDDAVMHEGEHRLLGIDAGAAEHALDRDRPEGGEQFADILRGQSAAGQATRFSARPCASFARSAQCLPSGKLGCSAPKHRALSQSGTYRRGTRAGPYFWRSPIRQRTRRSGAGIR